MKTTDLLRSIHFTDLETEAQMEEDIAKVKGEYLRMAQPDPEPKSPNSWSMNFACITLY